MYCKKMLLPVKKCSTNRAIGGWAPSRYLSSLEAREKVSTSVLLEAIEQATGKVIAGKDSEEVVARFGAKLI